TRYVRTAGTIAPTSQRTRGVVAPEAIAIAAPATNANAAIVANVIVTYTSVYDAPEKIVCSANRRSYRPSHVCAARISSRNAHANATQRRPGCADRATDRPAIARRPPPTARKNSDITMTITPTLSSHATIACHAGRVKK